MHRSRKNEEDEDKLHFGRKLWEIRDSEANYGLWLDYNRRKVMNCKTCFWGEPEVHRVKCVRYPQVVYKDKDDRCGEYKKTNLPKDELQSQQKE